MWCVELSVTYRLTSYAASSLECGGMLTSRTSLLYHVTTYSDNRWPSDDEFKDAFVEFHLYNPRRLGRTRLILESLEDSFEHRESPNITEDITIEHVMPQTLTTEWKDMLGPKAEEVHSQ